MRSSISLTGQYAAVDNMLTGHENLTFFGTLAGLSTREAKDRATELLTRFGLERAADSRVADYSGGMRRRLDIASSLTVQPPLLFLDEPTTGLDPASRNDVWDMVHHLQADGTSILLTTQYLDEADHLADRIVVLGGGRVLDEGTSAELKSRYGSSAVTVTFRDPALAEHFAGIAADHGFTASQENTIVRLDAPDGHRSLARAIALGRFRGRHHRRRADPADARGRVHGGRGLRRCGTYGSPYPGRRPAMNSGNTSPSMSASAAITSVWSRDFKRVIRNKSVLPSIFVIPAIFIAIFYGAFSRATDGFGISYATFLQGLIFTAGGSSLAVAQDAEDGIHARIRTMPAPNWSLVAGRLLADLTRGAISIVPVIVLTVLIGARFHGGAVDLLLLILLTVGAAVSISAIADGLCLLAHQPVSTSLMFQGLTIPIVMLSTAFVHLPLSTMVDTARLLINGDSPGSTGIEALCWIIVFLVAGIYGFLAAISRKSHV